MRTTFRVLGACFIAVAAISAASAQQPTSNLIKWGDATVTGFASFRLTTTSAGRHLVAVHGANELIRLVSPKRGLSVSCARVEGDALNETIQTLTMSGGVHASITRPSSNKASGETQTATTAGEEAIYSASTDKLHVTGGVNLADEDPGAGRSLQGAGDTADLVLSPQASNEEAFRSVSLDGNVKIDVSGYRIDSGKRVPFKLHSKCNHASFQSEARTITLAGQVYVTSDDPTVGESYVEREVIHLNADGSIESIEGSGDPGTTSVDLGRVKP